ncbi:hypothetical protein FRB96_006386 [Tulasnella sp. 330]|nr:hypothetical protein FRB96_006386 [Tulasnella sp. 330]KAG8876279.1 hypothetical protein FRB97_004293 [Tulasnella sp. 331]KAG8881545.1 hypothetical protein FRB98_004261 [Tulasnella sp. 332]
MHFFLTLPTVALAILFVPALMGAPTLSVDGAVNRYTLRERRMFNGWFGPSEEELAAKKAEEQREKIVKALAGTETPTRSDVPGVVGKGSQLERYYNGLINAKGDEYGPPGRKSLLAGAIGEVKNVIKGGTGREVARNPDHIFEEKRVEKN